MNNLRIISPAEWEYTEALGWYAERSRRAAERFDDEFERILKAIAETRDAFHDATIGTGFA